MKIEHTFKSSRDRYGYGYYGYIDKDTKELVIGENWPHEGGDLYRGTFAGAHNILNELKDKAPRLYNDIHKYYINNPNEAGALTLQALKPGDHFVRDNTEYVVIDFDVSKCFVFGDKMSSLKSVLCLDDFKLYLFSSELTILKI